MSDHSLIPCPVCKIDLALRVVYGRKSNKPFLMLICPTNGRHFRGFIADREYVRNIMDRAEEVAP